jgi:hypothetical protein
MAGRSNTTLKKRQKEMARAEKQRDKFAKRLERKRGDHSGTLDNDVEQTVGDSTPAETLAEGTDLPELSSVAG